MPAQTDLTKLNEEGLYKFYIHEVEAFLSINDGKGRDYLKESIKTVHKQLIAYIIKHQLSGVDFKPEQNFIIVYPKRTIALSMKNYKIFSEVIEYIFETSDIDPLAIQIPRGDIYIFSAYMYHNCFAKGRISESDIEKEFAIK